MRADRVLVVARPANRVVGAYPSATASRVCATLNLLVDKPPGTYYGEYSDEEFHELRRIAAEKEEAKR